MPGRKRKESSNELSKAKARKLDSVLIIGKGGPIDKVLDEEKPAAAEPAAEPAAAAEPAGAAAAAEPAASSTTKKWGKFLEKHLKENPQKTWTKEEMEAEEIRKDYTGTVRAHLKMDKTGEANSQMFENETQEARNEREMQELKEANENPMSLGGTKKNNKNKKKNKKNKTKKGGKQTRRGGKKTRRRNKTLKRKLSK